MLVSACIECSRDPGGATRFILDGMCEHSFLKRLIFTLDCNACLNGGPRVKDMAHP